VPGQPVPCHPTRGGTTLSAAPKVLAAVVLLIIWTAGSHFMLNAADSMVARLELLEAAVFYADAPLDENAISGCQ
jgi:hypothetical protein